MLSWYYWIKEGFSPRELDGYFKLVEWDEAGISAVAMTERELDDELQSIAHEFGMTEEQVEDWAASRVISGAERSYRWERYLQGQE